jgi:hypothetical protein
MKRSRRNSGLDPVVSAIIPPHVVCHRLFRNNYPATAFDHDLSHAVEAALLFISINSFLCDPQGFTCITLHFFSTIFLKCSSAIPERTGRDLPRIHDFTEETSITVVA